MRSTQETDSGKYNNEGIYTTKNGKNEFGGLGCPKGTRLYDTSMKQAIFFLPDDIQKGEDFEPITDIEAKDILPYYAISNYGRVMNIKSGKIIKPNLRPNGYQYVCLAANNCKNGQKKYSVHRLVLKKFEPVDNMDQLTVNHKDLDKTNNCVNKIMPDGSIYSNIEWATMKENIIHAEKNNVRIHNKLNYEKAQDIRDLHNQGYSYKQIKEMKYQDVSTVSIQNVCLNKSYNNPNYTPKLYNDCYKNNPANIHRLTDKDANIIRDLNNHGYNYKEIRDKFFPDFSISTVSDICRGISHNR